MDRTAPLTEANSLLLGDAPPQDSDALALYAAMSTGNWAFTKSMPQPFYTEQTNAELREEWQVTRLTAPFCLNRGDRRRQWTGRGPAAALLDACLWLATEGFEPEAEVQAVFQRNASLPKPEIERRYLVTGSVWQQGLGSPIKQGYLNRDKHRTVRVRLDGDKAYLTIKGLKVGASAPEYEYGVPVIHAEEMLLLCEGPLVEKTRYHVHHEGSLWSVDVFHGLNEGLVIAEIELDSEDQAYALPGWLGEEITKDFRYSNANLSKTPYTTWETP